MQRRHGEPHRDPLAAAIDDIAVDGCRFAGLQDPLEDLAAAVAHVAAEDEIGIDADRNIVSIPGQGLEQAIEGDDPEPFVEHRRGMGKTCQQVIENDLSRYGEGFFHHRRTAGGRKKRQ